MSRPKEEKPGFLDILLWRLIVFICFTAVIYFSWPFYQKMKDSGFFPDPDIEITGFQPNEKVTIKRSLGFYESEREAQADKSGKAVFHDLSPGNWNITRGGTEKLRNATIHIPDRHGIFVRRIEQFHIKIIYQRGS